MADDNILSKAVGLLIEIEESLQCLPVSKSGLGSARMLSRKVRLARALLEGEQKRPDTNWWYVAEVCREAAKLVVKLLIDNIQYKFCPRFRGYEVSGLGSRACA